MSKMYKYVWTIFRIIVIFIIVATYIGSFIFVDFELWKVAFLTVYVFFATLPWLVVLRRKRKIEGYRLNWVSWLMIALSLVYYVPYILSDWLMVSDQYYPASEIPNPVLVLWIFSMPIYALAVLLWSAIRPRQLNEASY